MHIAYDSYQEGWENSSSSHNRNISTGRVPMIVEFPDTKSEKLIDNAMDALGDWVEGQLEIGLSPIVLIGLIETYKAALTSNLLIDEED